LAVLFVAAIIGFTSCEEVEYDHEIFVKNQSSFTIRVEYLPEYEVSPRSFSISPGAERKVTTKHSTPIQFNWHRTDTGNQTGVRYVNDHPVRGGTFYNN
jgi:hypothetical protein